MALSFLSINSGLLDLQTIFDPQHSLQLQQQQQQQQHPHQHQEEHHQPLQRSSNTTKLDFSIFNDFDQMEYNNNNSSNRNHNQYQNHLTNNNNNNNNNSNNNNSNNNHNNIHTHQPNSGNINQIQNRHYMSGYHHQHTGSDYEQVINFVDSPPNSEESWTDTQSKDSPGPQIIDVQTIYSNSGSRKRRMDWDSLDIGQSENSPATQSGELPNKVSHQEKDKHKREKQSGRSSWSDDIGFDLNAEFNSNSYLNNESFLTFSPGLTALKQEPQSEQLKTPNSSSNSKSPLAHAKLDKSPLSDSAAQRAIQTEGGKISGKHELNGNGSGAGGAYCGCGSPQGSPTAQDYELNAAEKTSGGAGNGNGNNTVDAYARNNGAVLQQLSVVDAAKIENSPGVGGTSAHSEDHKFQYILAAATSIATKNNEETLTYLNQGQSYEIKLKKIGDLSFYRDKILKSVIKICFHERRLQFMEREQMQQWQASRPGERIIEVDVPLSYGLCHVSQPLNPNSLNTVEIFWDPLKEVGVYIKVNCISTEFTPKKHGGEKGVPFRLQIETYIESTSNNNNNNNNGNSNNNNTNNSSNNNNNNNSNNNNTTSSSSTSAVVAAAAAVAAQSPGTPGNRTPNGNISGAGSSSSSNSTNSSSSGGSNNNAGGILNAASALAATLNGKQAVHAAACQIKVFKLKGADRKHKQDREKIQKRPQSEQEKFQPSYECTIMNDIALDLIVPNAVCYSPEYMKIWPNSPVHIPKYDGILPFTSASPANSSSPIAINSVTSTNSPTLKLMDATNMVSPQHVAADIDDYTLNIMPESTPAQVTQWLTNHRLTAYLTTFAHFSGADILRMSKEDLIQICGLADGIRMFNILRAKTISPRLTLYVSLDGSSYNAIYLISNTAKELTQKLFKLPGFYETVAKCANNPMENGVGGGLYNGWGMHSKYSGSGSNIFNDVNKSFIYVSGPSGVHVTVTDEVLNNEIKDGSLYALEVQNGKVVLKLINKSEN